MEQGREEQALQVTIDRFERDARGQRLAVLVFDDEQQLVVPQTALPKDSRRGDVLVLTFAPDPEATRTRAERVARLQHELFGE
ncbi:MAG: DUF3006 domain-containing protein [Chloroflexi bacterium]|nr:DUF3006 domain-containing protein [Chloroflexota bacterium]